MEIFDVLGFNLAKARAFEEYDDDWFVIPFELWCLSKCVFCFFFEISRFVDWMHDSIKQTQGDTKFSGEPMKINVQ